MPRITPSLVSLASPCSASRGRSIELHPRQTEIEQGDAGPGQHDVPGLQIAVEHAAAMRLGERVGDLDPVPQRLIERERPFARRAARVSPSRNSITRKSTVAFTAHVEDVADMRVTECRERS